MATQEERDRIMAEHLASQDDDEEEAEFEPDDEDDDDEDDDDEFDQDDDEDEEDYILMKGTLSHHDGHLVYKGHILADTFELKSKPLHWNMHHPTASSSDETNSPPRMRTIVMEGNLGKDLTKVDLTLTVNESTSNGARKKDDSASKPTKSGDDDEKSPSKPAAAEAKTDGEDGKKPASVNGETGSVCSVFGRGSDASGAFEFFGTLQPSHKHHVSLECQKRTVTKAPVAAAAAAASNEDDDDDDDADEGVDYDELIDLHQDAGLSLTELRKRYNPTAEEEKEPSKKKAKADESDEEYGF